MQVRLRPWLLAPQPPRRAVPNKPVFDELEHWLKLQLPKISGKTKLAEAIRYALGRMPKARPYLDNGCWNWTTTASDQSDP